MVAEPTAMARKAQKWRQEVRNAHFPELGNLVRLLSGRIVELKVLKRG